MSPTLWRIYSLLAGNLSDEVLTSSSSATPTKVDWRTVLGMHYWYSTEEGRSLQKALGDCLKTQLFRPIDAITVEGGNEALENGNDAQSQRNRANTSGNNEESLSITNGGNQNDSKRKNSSSSQNNFLTGGSSSSSSTMAGNSSSANTSGTSSPSLKSIQYNLFRYSVEDLDCSDLRLWQQEHGNGVIECREQPA